jgi:peptidylprolyl isomerase
MIRNLKRVPVLLLLMGSLIIFGQMIWVFPVAAEDRIAKDGDTVSIHYTGKLEDKSVFDTSENREPLVFTLGEEYIIPGMNGAIRGMKAGESKTVTIPPAEAYGPYSKKLVFEVPTKNLPPEIKAGTPLRDPQGNMVLVKEVNGEKSTLDANHILAGKTLIFDIELVSISDGPLVKTPSPKQ